MSPLVPPLVGSSVAVTSAVLPSHLNLRPRHRPHPKQTSRGLAHHSLPPPSLARPPLPDGAVSQFEKATVVSKLIGVLRPCASSRTGDRTSTPCAHGTAETRASSPMTFSRSTARISTDCPAQRAPERLESLLSGSEEWCGAVPACLRHGSGGHRVKAD
jgi:hypothetical protein